MQSELIHIKSQLARQHSMLVGLSRHKSSTSPHTLLIRSIVCRLAGRALRRDPHQLAEERYRNHQGVRDAIDNPASVFKAATSPAMTTVPTWAGGAVDTYNIFDGALPTLAPTSIFSQLYARGLQADVGNAASLRLPYRVETGNLPSPFVGESQPIPVRQLDFGGAVLKPHKVGIISHFTAEIARSSTQSIEGIVRTALAEDAGAQIDQILLGSAAATPTQPAGLLFGVTPVTASASTVLTEAAVADLSALLGAIDPPPVAPVFITDGGTATRLRLLLPASAAIDVLATDAVPVGTIIAIDSSDFAATLSGAEITIVDDATLVSRTDPSPVIDAAGVEGVPTTSLWQLDLLAVRVLEDIGWTLRRPGRVSFVESIAW